MNYNEFIQWATNATERELDYDKISGVQCVDLIKHYIKKVRKIEPKSIGNANQYWYKRYQEYIQKVISNGGTLISVGKGNKTTVKAGDIVVMMKDGSSTGHICIGNGVNSTNYFKSYDTNWGGWRCQLITHRYDSDWYILGLIRISSTYTQIDSSSDEDDDGSSSDEGHIIPEIITDEDIATVIMKILNII